MSIQFKHVRNHSNLSNGGATFAVDLSDNPLNQIQVNDVIEVKTGIAKCALDDCFNKKIGREISSSRLTNIPFTVTQIMKYRGRDSKVVTKVVLERDNMYLCFSRSSDSQTFRLHSASLAY